MILLKLRLCMSFMDGPLKGPSIKDVRKNLSFFLPPFPPRPGVSKIIDYPYPPASHFICNFNPDFVHMNNGHKVNTGRPNKNNISDKLKSLIVESNVIF